MTSARAAVALVAAGTLAGCVTLKRTPEARFFALRPVAVMAASPAATGVHDRIVGVLPVSLPGFLERPQLVTWSGRGELRIDEFLRWGEPLQGGVQRVLAQDLQRLLPSDRVIRSPWGRSAALRCRVRTELVRLGPEPGGEVSLSGRFVLLAADMDTALLARDVELRRDPGQRDPGRAVEAMSALLADLAAQVAEAIDALPSKTGETAAQAQAAQAAPRFEP